MRFIKIYTILALTLISMSCITAQERFDRLYRVQPDRSMFGQSIQQLENETYVVLSTVDTIDPGVIDPTMTNLTTFDLKGNVNFSNDYAFEDTISLFAFGNVVDLEQGFILSAMSAVDSVYNNLVFRVDQAGNPVWSNKYGSGTEGDQVLFSKIDILNTSDSVLILMGSAKTDAGQQMLVTGIDIETGDQLWSKALDLPGDDTIDPFNRNMTLTQDSTVLITGSDSANELFFIIEVSPNDGSIIWSEKYDVRFLDNSNLVASDVAVAEDSTIVVTGIVVNAVIGANDAFIVKFDRRGNILWSQFMNAGPSIKTNGQSIDILDNGNIVVMIGGQNNDAGAFFPIQSVLSPAGALLAASDFSIFLNSTSNSVEIVPTVDGGAIFAGTGIEHGIDSAPGTDLGFFYTRLIKTNADAQTPCEMDLVASLDTILLGNDTLLWDAIDLPLDKDTLEITTVGFGQYTAPILSLRDTMFCPGDPVLFLLDATTRGATQYKWYDAEEPTNILSTDSMFIATELDVQYVAEVFIEEDLCYIMCDTTVLTDLDPPTVQIQANSDRFCLERLFELQAMPQGGSLTRLEWSTGEVDLPVIVVSELGTYSVTVTNVCDDTGTTSFTVSDPNLPPPLVSLGLDTARFCSEGIFELVATIDGREIQAVEWSTGASGVETTRIEVTETGTYSITVTDECDISGSTSISITEDNLPGNANLQLGDPDSCTSPGDVILTINQANSFSNILWNTGATTESITVTEAGTYSVTALDRCGFDVSDEANVRDDDFIQPLEIEIVSENCDGDNVDLSVSVLSGIAQTFTWTVTDQDDMRTTLEGNEQTNEPADRTYEVTVTDNCANTAMDSITDPCQCLQFPNAFYPDSRIDDDINKNFGPVNSCSNITSYNLQIFNRWGQKIFESDAIDDEWNGMKGSSDVRGDVFVYVATYETEGGEFSVKGDVTLLK